MIPLVQYIDKLTEICCAFILKHRGLSNSFMNFDNNCKIMSHHEFIELPVGSDSTYKSNNWMGKQGRFVDTIQMTGENNNVEPLVKIKWLKGLGRVCNTNDWEIKVEPLHKSNIGSGNKLNAFQWLGSVTRWGRW
jgi:hypothetical protein